MSAAWNPRGLDFTTMVDRKKRTPAAPRRERPVLGGRGGHSGWRRPARAPLVSVPRAGSLIGALLALTSTAWAVGAPGDTPPASRADATTCCDAQPPDATRVATPREVPCATPATGANPQDAPTPCWSYESPLELADRVVRDELAVRPARHRAWNWETAVLLHALVAVAPAGPRDPLYLSYVQEFYAAHERSGVPATTTPDLAVLALPVVDLQLDRGIVVGRRTLAATRKFFAAEPINPLGVLDHVGRHHRFRPWLPLTRRFTRPAVWVDSLVMAVLTEAHLAQLDGDRERLERVLSAPIVYAAALQSPNGLFKHAFYYTRDERVPHGDAHWLRGHAWALLALVELIEIAPGDSVSRPALINVFVRAATALLAETTAEGGMWPTLIGRTRGAGAVEVAGSLLAAAALARGYRRGLLEVDALVAASATFATLPQYIVCRGSRLRIKGMSSATNAARFPVAYTHPLRREKTNAGYGLAGLLLLAAELDAAGRVGGGEWVGYRDGAAGGPPVLSARVCVGDRPATPTTRRGAGSHARRRCNCL